MILYTLGIDPGFAKSPMGGALIRFQNGRPLIEETFTIRPRCGGDWQERQYDVLVQLDERIARWRRDIPADMLLLAYACTHLRERKGKKERANGTHVLNPQTVLHLTELCGGLRGLAVSHRIACIGVQEAESKVALASDSQATKQDMVRAAERLFNTALDEHCADAVAHALAGEANYRRARLVREAQICSK